MSSSCSSYLDQGTQKTLVLDLPFAPKRRDLAWRWNKPKNLGRKRWPGARRLKLEPWKSNLLLKTWHCRIVSSLDVWLLQVVIYLYPQWLKTSIISIPIKLTILTTQGQEGFASEGIAELIVGLQNQVWMTKPNRVNIPSNKPITHPNEGSST